MDFNTDFKSKKVGLHEYGFQMNDTNVQPDGSCAAEFEVIPGNGQTSFVYDSKVATQNTALDKENIANVVFTIGWSDENATRPQLNATHKISKPKMDAALKKLTGKLTFTTTAYQGEGGIDISEAGDGSVMAVISGQDATVYSEGGVLGIDTIGGNSQTAMFFDYNAREMDLHGLDMSKVVNGLNMFAYCKFATLNLSGIDMGQMTNVHGMFVRCDFLKTINLSNTNMSSVTSAYAMFNFCPSLTTLDLSDVNMSQVMNTGFMFQGCTSLTTLDLSGINMSKETDTTAMFDRCFALRTCYAKTQQDCDKLNNSGTSGWPKPSNVNFIVKPAA